MLMKVIVKMNSIMVSLRHCDWICVDLFSCYVFL